MRAFILAVTGLAIGVAACGSYDGTSVIEVQKQQVASVLVSLPSASLVAGQTQRATVDIKDSNGAALTGRAVVWYTSAATVATVNDSGDITALAAGAATVSAVSEGVAGQAPLTVVPRPPLPVARVVVAINPSAVVVGQIAHATVALQDSIGNALTDRAVSWQSGNSSVASVSGTGDVTAVGPGTTSITATSEGKAASAALSVSAPAPIAVASVSVSPASVSLAVGGTQQLSATTRDANNNVLTGRTISWASGNTLAARVSSSGLVTAVAAGSVSITASSEGQTGSSAFTIAAVPPPPPPPPVPVATVVVSPPSASVSVGGSVQLSAATSDANGNPLTGRSVSWSSSDQAVGTVSASGRFTAIAAGTATVTALSETKTGTSLITVNAPPPPPPPPPGGTGTWRANEPAGMTRITDRPFSAVVEDGFDPYGSDNFTIVQDANAPHSPSNVLRATYPAGFGAGGAPARTGISHTEYSKIYICFAVKLSSNWVGNGSGVNKMLYEWTSIPHPSFFFAAVGAGSDILTPRVMLQDVISSPSVGGFVAPNLVPGAQIVRGRWHQIEVFIQGNTAGTANGQMDWYLDGVHVGSIGNFQWTSGATQFSAFEVNPIWGGGNTSPAITSTQTMDWDHLYVSGKN